MLILLLPRSVASNTEDKIYKMAADGILLVDDRRFKYAKKMQH